MSRAIKFGSYTITLRVTGKAQMSLATTDLQVAGNAILSSILAAVGVAPTGGATSANQTNGTQQTKVTDGTNIAAVKAASTAPAATDPAAVVSLSPNGNTVQAGVAAIAPAVQNLALSTTSATQFGSAPCVRGVWIEALSTNTASVFIGPAGVTTGTGLELQAGDREFFPEDNANRFYAITGTTTQNLRLLAI